MMLQALCRLSKEKELVSDPDYEPKPIPWLARVDRAGRLLGIEGTHQMPAQPTGKRRPRQVPKKFLMPREPARTSGDQAMLLYDKAEYVFGIDPETDETRKRPAEKLASRQQLFLDRIRECLQETSDDGVKAVLNCLEDIRAGRQPIELPHECTPSDLFAFVYAPDVDILVTDREQVRAYWKALRSMAVPQDSRCLVSGAHCAPVDKHPPIKRLPGGSSSGVALVSFNSNAFESYGWKRNQNAPVSREAAEACSTALNRLLDPAFPDPQNPGQTLPRRNLRLSADTVVCYWTAGKGAEEFATAFGYVMEAEKPEEVRQLYQSIWRGQAPEIDDPSAFYALTLSGAQGRATVRDWFESTVQTVAQNLARHFLDLDVVRNTPKPRERELLPQIPLRALLESLAPQGKSDGVPAALASQFVRAALHGTAYPFSMLQRAVLRMRAEIGKTKWPDWQRRDARAALIKAVLNRRSRFLSTPSHTYQEVKRHMDPTNTNPGYLLGRLLAVIERLQQTALGDVNATVVDRYFSAASAAPRSVFVRLLKNARHHARKAKDAESTAGQACWLDGQIDEISVSFDPKNNGFPPSLSLEEQGLFVLGYHHQRHWLWMSKAQREEWQAAQAQ